MDELEQLQRENDRLLEEISQQLDEIINLISEMRGQND